ncbi:MAG: hypothetical protein JXA19_00285 [Anaerolineales bacterium]|nr:hypothetical protein [Anaerolineales bacterium]
MKTIIKDILAFPSLTVLFAILLSVVIPLALYRSAKRNIEKSKESKTIDKMRETFDLLKSPWQEESNNLNELSDLVGYLYGNEEKEEE